MRLSLRSLLSLAFVSFQVTAAPPLEHVERHPFSVGQGVRTSSGLVVGQPAASRPGVSEYLGIPFAKPPTGNLRFAAPKAYKGAGTVNATAFSPSCPSNAQASTGGAEGLSLAGPNSFRILAEIAQVGDTFSEDCLTLNIWTKPQTGEKAKAVLFWIYGGGFQNGNTNNPVYNGQYFADNEDVIVVSANYRVNIFGFPGLPGMDQNIGLLDQRLAIEWTRKNIAAFGGDPCRITIFGQSAGGGSVDLYSYAWTHDPIVAGFIPQSGTAATFGNTIPPNNTAAWFNATQKLECGGPSAGIPATVACMRTKTFQEILNAIVLPPGLAAVTGQFGPSVDNKVVFDNYKARSAAGQFIKKPYLTGSNDYEAGLFKVIAASAGASRSDLEWAIGNLASFTCPAASAALTRTLYGVPTWRYRYFGEFPNLRLTLNPNSGAYHGAEVPEIFQTSEVSSGAPNIPAETAISSYLQGAWARFAKNPAHGLSGGSYKWPRYNATSKSLVRLAYNNETTASYIFPITYDLACPTLEAALAAIPGGLAGLTGSSSPPDLSFLAQFTNLTAMGGGSEVGY